MSVDVGILREKIARLTDERDRLLTEVAGAQNLSGILNLMGVLLASSEADAKMCEWISVEERLPEPTDFYPGVWVWDAVWQVGYEAWYNTDDQAWVACSDREPPERITHWMPLPAAPPVTGEQPMTTPNRNAAQWNPMDDEHTNDPSIWAWGDWAITRELNGYHLLVSSGVEYGPFATFEQVKQHAENVRGD